MGFLCGFAGAFLGAIVGLAAVLLGVAVLSDGNDIGDAFAFVGLAPVGLIIGAILGIVAALKLRQYTRKTWGIKSVRRKTALILAASVLATPALVTVALWGAYQSRQPPSDQQLLRNFNRNRITFNELAQMTQADKELTRVDYDWTQPSDPRTVGVSAERIRKYRYLLNSINVHRGFQSDTSHNVEFMYYATGSAISSDTNKGYTYLTVPPKQTLNTLDDCQPDEKNGVEAYRHIEGHWYLYYEYLPG